MSIVYICPLDFTQKEAAASSFVSYSTKTHHVHDVVQNQIRAATVNQLVVNY